MFVLKSKYNEVKDQLAQVRIELNVTHDTRRKYAEALRKFCPWYFKYPGYDELDTQPETEYYFQLYSWKPEGLPRVYRFYLCSSGNNKQIMKSEEYNSKRNATEAIERLLQRLGSSFKPVIYDSGMNRIN